MHGRQVVESLHMCHWVLQGFLKTEREDYIIITSSLKACGGGRT